MELILIGRPGSGKTTLGTALSASLHIPYISSGEIARALAEDDPTTALGLKSGEMAPEDTMRRKVKEHLEKAVGTSGGFILEGFPRTVAQYIALRMWGHLPFAFVLEVSELESIERLVDRAREDDTPDAIAQRLNNYREQTVPLVNVLGGSGAYCRLDTRIGVEAMIRQAENSVANV